MYRPWNLPATPQPFPCRASSLLHHISEQVLRWLDLGFVLPESEHGNEHHSNGYNTSDKGGGNRDGLVLTVWTDSFRSLRKSSRMVTCWRVRQMWMLIHEIIIQKIMSFLSKTILCLWKEQKKKKEKRKKHLETSQGRASHQSGV